MQSKIETVRDKFVFGLRDDKLKERLLQGSNITLNKLVALAQRMESSRQQIKEMKENDNEKSLDAVIREVSCGQCGLTHKPRECPAYRQRCSICHKHNHLARVCHSKNQNVAAHRAPTTPNQKKRIYIAADDNKVTENQSQWCPWMHCRCMGCQSLHGSPLLMFITVKSHLSWTQVQRQVSSH